MDYIHSQDIFLLMRDTLKLVNHKVMDHGSRVAYYLYKMLECKGGYEKFELADFVFLGSLHDIGAYRTENLQDMIRYECRDSMAHSIYGYLIFKNLSPISELARIILYHHTDYSELSTLDAQSREVAACLNLVGMVDIYSSALGDKFDLGMFRKQQGTVFGAQAIRLFDEAVAKHDILGRVRSDEYKMELQDITDYMIFNNADKKKAVELLMYVQGFKEEALVFNTVTCMCIAENLGHKIGLNSLEREQLYYATLLHDIGMLAIPKEITQAPRKLTGEEYKKVKMHVHLAEKILKDRMAKEVIQIVAAHHERCDGSGYPRGLKEMQMNRSQQILQLADATAAMLSERPNRPPLEREELQELIRNEAIKGKFNKNIVNLFLDSYDEIMEYVKAKVDETLLTYRKLNRQYQQVLPQIKEH